MADEDSVIDSDEMGVGRGIGPSFRHATVAGQLVAVPYTAGGGHEQSLARSLLPAHLNSMDVLDVRLQLC